MIEAAATKKVAINGFGRIGRNFLRCWNGRESTLLDVVAINDSGGVKQVRAHHEPVQCTLSFRCLLLWWDSCRRLHR